MAAPGPTLSAQQQEYWDRMVEVGRAYARGATAGPPAATSATAAVAAAAGGERPAAPPVFVGSVAAADDWLGAGLLCRQRCSAARWRQRSPGRPARGRWVQVVLFHGLAGIGGPGASAALDYSGCKQAPQQQQGSDQPTQGTSLAPLFDRHRLPLCAHGWCREPGRHLWHPAAACNQQQRVCQRPAPQAAAH